jgi:hypothetical protein
VWGTQNFEITDVSISTACSDEQTVTRLNGIFNTLESIAVEGPVEFLAIDVAAF